MKPVIDVHAHICNAMDLPLMGYLLSRRSKSPFERILLPILAPILAACLRRKLDPRRGCDPFSDARCDFVLRAAFLALGKQVRGWAETLAKPVKEITEELFDTYRKDDIDLFVPLMLDYEYWFVNTPDRLMACQVENLYRNIVLPSKGRIHPFVPFDPARELAYRYGVTNPDGEPEEHGSMNLVKDAIDNKGFIGVKVYNAMGYKPIHNATVEAHRLRLPQHDSRYRFSGADYDAVLSELYLYCVENEIPVTAHCFMDGMESYPDASWDFGQARFWRDVLDRPAFRNLRLNLAHFGWNKDQRYDGDRAWVRDICEMLPRYPHLYTDSAHHRVILDDKRDLFKEDYRKICARTPVVKERLLFGTDWHVVKRVRNFENFKACYREVLAHDGLFSEEELADFFGGNALRFLGLRPGDRNRDRLERFYADEGIDPPAWFVSAGEKELV